MQDKKYDVICAGIATWDTLFSGIDSDLMEVDGIQAKGYTASSGGDAVNAAVNMARLGIRTAVCASVGNDNARDLIMRELQAAGADTQWITVHEHLNTAAPVLLIDHQGERHIVRVPDNANHFFDNTMVPFELMDQASHLHLASANVLNRLDGQPLGQLFKDAKAHGLSTSLDASYDRSGNWMKNIETALQYCDIFVPSIQEAAIYAGSHDIEEISSFFSQYPLKIFGIKLGEKGVYLTDFKESVHLPTLYRGKPVDTTGAGDAFLAGFVSAWVRGYDMRSCGLLGSAQSASVLGSIGANRSAGTWDDALKRIGEAGEQISLREDL